MLDNKHPQQPHVYSCTLDDDHVGECSPEYDEWYELWDGEAGNMIGHFDKLPDAARRVLLHEAAGTAEHLFLRRCFEPKRERSND